MDAELKTKWIDGLENGEYEQVNGALCKISETDNSVMGYCCIGVLLEVAHIGDWIDHAGQRFYSPDDNPSEHWGGKVEDYGFLEFVLGMTLRQQSDFIAMNDKEKLSFAEIAKRVNDIL